MANLGLFAVYKIISEYMESILKYSENTVHGENKCLSGKDAKRVLAYSPNKP
jgi:hypothetical protein